MLDNIALLYIISSNILHQCLIDSISAQRLFLDLGLVRLVKSYVALGKKVKVYWFYVIYWNLVGAYSIGGLRLVVSLDELIIISCF